ncbi:hypothetical protein Plim_2296 [Planctopirus limnophila DSM 3776]|uniref:Lipoprotein n=2 Tax=Planctopirus limnophila TaxID=120 RepID=D5SNK8_PLAL2|nr:hypothetical protein Plim_2296 [Planctopirus limnophila DSM 3776]
MHNFLRLLAVSFTAAAVGCIGIMRANEFKILPALATAQADASSFEFEVVPKMWESIDILPLCMVFYTPPPHDLDLDYVKPEDSGYEILVIEEAWIEFEDGKTTSLVSRSEPLQLLFNDVKDKDGNVNRKASYRFEAAVSQIASFEIRMSGRMLMLDGTEQAFNMTRQIDGAVKTSVHDFATWCGAI